MFLRPEFGISQCRNDLHGYDTLFVARNAVLKLRHRSHRCNQQLSPQDRSLPLLLVQFSFADPTHHDLQNHR